MATCVGSRVVRDTIVHSIGVSVTGLSPPASIVVSDDFVTGGYATGFFSPGFGC